MAITGTIRKSDTFLDGEAILRMTSYGYDIYMYYLGKISRNTNCPWRRDRKPSWGVYCYDGMWFWKDQATEEAGTAIQLVEKLYGLSYKEACWKIVQDFGLKKVQEESRWKSPVVKWDEPTDEDKNYARISFSTKPWTKEHHEFYASTEVTPQHAERYQTYAVKDCAINRRKVTFMHPNEVVWAYYCPEEDAVKLYFPERGQDEFNPKFRGNVSGNHLWNYENLLRKCGDQPCKKGIIQKSMKDLLITSIFTENVIATQNEQAKLLVSEFTIEKVDKIFQKVWMAFGSDPDGVRKSHKVSVWTGWNWVNPKKELLPEINDFYGLAKAQGPEAVQTLLKEKGFL